VISLANPGRLFVKPSFFIIAGQPLPDIFQASHTFHGEPLLQQGFGFLKILVFRCGKKAIAIGPADPAPPPSRICRQPLLEECVAPVSIAAVETARGQSPTHVFDQEGIACGKAMQKLLAQINPALMKARIFPSSIVQFHLRILNPIENGLCSSKSLIEVFQGAEGAYFCA
jgi:hypothetical protein